MIHPDRIPKNSQYISWDNAKSVKPASQKSTAGNKLLFPWIDTSSSSGPPINSGNTSGSSSSSGSRSSGGSGGSVSSQQKKAAKNQTAISKFNAQTVRDEWKAANANYKLSNKENKALTKINMQNNSRTASGDRFAQLQRMQASTSGLMAGAGNALQGGQAMNIANMLKQRNGMDNNESLSTLRTNQNAEIDSLNEALLANTIARNTAAAAAERQLRNMEADLAAQLNNINPKLFAKPGKGKANLGAKGFSKKRTSTPTRKKAISYFTDAPTTTSAPAPQSTGSSYFDQLMRGGY